ncbi:MAG: HIT domain-containing protein [Nanoarchaeota archaeon]|nr:HIT domain-containing protein [Nanoarchaeota archaeon]
MNPEQIIEAQKQQCIFCKIISGEIPSKKVFEDEIGIVILDINPANEGHVLVLPKKHYQIMPQIPETEIDHLFILAKKSSHSLLKGLGLKGTTIFVANGQYAGQKAPHFMIHVIPRVEGDGLFGIRKSNVDEKLLDDIANKISSRLGTKQGSMMIEHSDDSNVSDEIEDENSKPEIAELIPQIETLSPSSVNPGFSKEKIVVAEEEDALPDDVSEEVDLDLEELANIEHGNGKSRGKKKPEDTDEVTEDDGVADDEEWKQDAESDEGSGHEDEAHAASEKKSDDNDND